jgi:hypothetical protein
MSRLKNTLDYFHCICFWYLSVVPTFEFWLVFESLIQLVKTTIGSHQTFTGGLEINGLGIGGDGRTASDVFGRPDQFISHGFLLAAHNANAAAFAVLVDDMGLELFGTGGLAHFNGPGKRDCFRFSRIILLQLHKHRHDYTNVLRIAIRGESLIEISRLNIERQCRMSHCR